MHQHKHAPLPCISVGTKNTVQAIKSAWCQNSWFQLLWDVISQLLPIMSKEVIPIIMHSLGPLVVGPSSGVYSSDEDSRNTLIFCSVQSTAKKIGCFNHCMSGYPGYRRQWLWDAYCMSNLSPNYTLQLTALRTSVSECISKIWCFCCDSPRCSVVTIAD